MKKTLGILSVLAIGGVAHAEVNVNGYVDVGYDWAKDGGEANNFIYREGGIWLSGNSGSTSFLLDLGVDGENNATGMSGVGLVEQAYVAHKMDNGFSWTLGQFDAIIGMESNDSVNNKFVGTGVLYDLLPSSHTGLLFGYDLSDALALNLIVADGAGTTTDIGFKLGTKMDGLNAYVGGLFVSAGGETGYTLDVGATTGLGGLDVGAELVLVKPAAANAESGLGFGVEAGSEIATATKLNAGFEWTNENAGDHMEFRIGPNHAASEALSLKADYTFSKTGEADAGHGIALAGVYKF